MPMLQATSDRLGCSWWYCKGCYCGGCYVGMLCTCCWRPADAMHGSQAAHCCMHTAHSCMLVTDPLSQLSEWKTSLEVNWWQSMPCKCPPAHLMDPLS